MLDLIHSHIKKLRLDAFIVTGSSNVEYLTGFTGSNKALVVKRTHAYLITDERYINRAKEEIRDGRLRLISSNDTLESIRRLCKQSGRVGFEPRHVTIARLTRLKQHLKPSRLIATDDLIEAIRRKKHRFEINLIRRACRITREIFDEITSFIAPGITEREAAWKIRELAFHKGIDEFAFDPIVAFGKNSALPHHKTGTARLKANDFMLLDFGVKYRGYCSDMTRVILPCTVPEKITKMYQACLEAKETVIAAIRPGMKFSEADRIARDILKRHGFEQYFTHSLGHGLGIDIHEQPSIHGKNHSRFEEGMIFTIEPGIYIPGLGGIRLEDTCLLSQKVKVLTQ